MNSNFQSTFKERLKSGEPTSLFGGSSDLWRYREAAAVLESFDRESLHPVGKGESEKSIKTELLADCDVSYDTDGTPRWALRPNIRQAALRRLAETGRIKEALGANPERRITVTQQLFEQFLTPSEKPFKPSPLTGFDPAFLKIIRWLDGVPQLRERLPSAEWVRQGVAREQLLEPFRALVGSTFAGRTHELVALSDYVGWYGAHTLRESLVRGVEYIFDIQKRPPLFISGPGGSGKSTLIAKFVLDHVDIHEGATFPFCYLDFDRPGLMAEEPVTLLTEMLRQLSIQFAESSDQAFSIADKWTQRMAELFKGDNDVDPVVPLSKLRFKERDSFLSEFKLYVEGLKSSDQPLLLVIDTFEEVQFRSSAYAEELFRFLNKLQASIPRLRTVLCGRIEFKSTAFPVKSVGIDDFDQEAAVAYLGAQGIEDVAIRRKIFEQVGGSPLVLKLASDVARIEKIGKSGLSNLPSSWLSIFSEKSIEIVLYKRILSHIVDPRVKELAFPGLVLRKLTPELVLQVLAPACEVSVQSLEDATGIVDTMRAQLNTILISSPGEQSALIHRSDMRWILLNDVKAKASKDGVLADKVNRIYRKAIDYYANFDDPERRAEEIHCRLQLGTDRKVLGSRWLNSLGPFLAPGIRELPEQAQIYLAARMQVELPSKLWDKAV